MSLQLSERRSPELPECCRGADEERRMTPDEVKQVLTYTCYDALNDVYKADADEALGIAAEIGAEYEKALAEYHKNCNTLVDIRSVKLCHNIVRYLSEMGGEVECTTDATESTFGISVDAYFSEIVSFAEDMEMFRSLLEQSEFRANVPYNGNKVCLSFYVQIGRYIPRETK